MALLAAVWTASAQRVVAVDGDSIELSVGASDGVRQGMTGKLCMTEVVSGEVHETCSAQFVVVATSQNGARVRVTKGVGRDARQGYRAKFDQKLVPKPSETKVTRKEKPVTFKESPSDRAFREADRAFEDGDCRGALERYESILEKYPRHSKVELAETRVESCRASLQAIGLPLPSTESIAGGAQAAVAAPVVMPPVSALPATAVEAEELADAAEQLLQNGELADARRTAAEALRKDSTNPRAHAISRTIYTKSVISRFNRPTDVSVTANGWCYVADTGNNTIRRIADASTTTVAGRPGEFDSVDGPMDRARFNEPSGVTVGRDGAVYVADRYSASIRRIAQDGRVATFAGRNRSAGTADGNLSAARFSEPRRLAIDRDGTMYVADTANHAVRKILPTGEVSTLAHGSGADRLVPFGIAVDTAGRVLVADPSEHVIRAIDRDGTMRVLAGMRGSRGGIDGPAASARFNAPEGVAVAGDGTIYIADSSNHTIRRIANGVVSTVAGRAGVSGFSDGIATAARFNDPSAIAVDARGNVWIADRGNHTIRLMADGFVSTVAGLAGEAGNSDGAN
jgi:sugar lactone lactonase YvrE